MLCTAVAGQSDRWSVICHSQPSAFHLEVIWGSSLRGLWADTQDISRWFPALFFSSQHRFCVVLAPRTSMLQKCGGKERSIRERFYTQHMCTSHYSDPRGFTQAWCLILSLVCDHTNAWFCAPHHQKICSFLANKPAWGQLAPLNHLQLGTPNRTSHIIY